MGAQVVSVARSGEHTFSKRVCEQVTLVERLGVEGDAHLGATVKHRSRVAADPNQPNLRQVHLIAAELLDEMAALGFALGPGDLGENILVRGLSLIDLPRGTRLRLGDRAEIEVTGLRNPCRQIEAFRPGLLKPMVGRDADGKPVLKTGIMGIVLHGGTVRPGDQIAVELPPEPHVRLERV
ncbi:MOSC domain-containing protein [Erythrobacter mangrovi]|uniref:MOSC domain-containing protein n=1 Tax=Erythrobacter mangrovi TaxID=2739433 RepID=A0A7D3XAH7_9SPHN|nr:MOSC domain-containing protein [Erythrobacter mangrovi]QKG70600.1 MOSC domain-containing protein [Erythrobacter mangrovi]